MPPTKLANHRPTSPPHPIRIRIQTRKAAQVTMGARGWAGRGKEREGRMGIHMMGMEDAVAVGGGRRIREGMRMKANLRRRAVVLERG